MWFYTGYSHSKPMLLHEVIHTRNPFIHWAEVSFSHIHTPTADTADIFLNIFNEKPIFSRKEVIHIMKIICSKSNLLKSVSISLKAVPSKTTMPILECILIDATTNQIKFTTNDMELGIETIVEGTIEEKGMVALNAKIFTRSSEDFQTTMLPLKLMKNSLQLSPVRKQNLIFLENQEKISHIFL